MPTLISDLQRLRDKLRDRATAEGFAECRVTTAALTPLAGNNLDSYVTQGFHGTMDWIAETIDRRRSPQALWPEARTAVIVSMSYGPDFDPLERLQQKSAGVISVYALNRDYHEVLKGKLKQLAHWFATRSGCEVKVFTDTAPVMEKPLAQQAGLGWQGKHSNLVSRRHGSWLFLGVMLTSCDLPVDESESDHCGSCTACLDVCPTKAFPSPYVVDARRCISYLTIEHKGHIDSEFRAAMGNRIYGCDDCLAVCPWNKFASVAREQKFHARVDLKEPRLHDLLKLDDAAFRKLFAGSPVKRIGRDCFIRNCLIATGNSGDDSLVPSVATLLHDASPLVRAMAVWALKTLDPMKAASFKIPEPDAAVLAEWTA
jgi:epoxyqueuosine reductase